MTEQQRINRIEFVKKLLVANGFSQTLSWKSYKKGLDTTIVDKTHCTLINSITHIVIYHDKPLKPLRDFIKLSNQ